MRKAILALTVVAVFSTVSFGHAKLIRSVPGDGAVLRTPPKVVSAWFNDELIPERSTISVWDLRGRRVDDGKGGVNLDDLDRKSMLARLRPLGDGSYIVRWQAASADDGYVARGTFRFTVKRY